ncbi:HofP DNA utilization family protein [Musicola keenii]|uniref:HofP DNA utilization family protein n=1 Tax=Musicola keenii TaxID=2884250 RepID=UPI001786A788|nr:HofP DNA utilization family protein [Musicola keenii]
MRLLWGAVCGFLLAGAQATEWRDPFQPIVSRACEQESAASWRLKGVIGDGLRWSGWLEQPQQGWRRVRLGEVLQPEGWRVVQLGRQGGVFRPEGGDAACKNEDVYLAAPLQHSSNGTGRKSAE